MPAYVIHDNWNDGWDFCDAVRAAAVSNSKTLTEMAKAYEKEWGTLQGGYTFDDFKALDARESSASRR